MPLFNHCIAVHATNFMPQNGVMTPGVIHYLNPGSKEEKEYCRSSYRQTLHWSLNQIAPRHEGGSWNHKKIAILTPLATLSDQLVNIAPLDTFVLGKVTLDHRFTVLAEQDVDTTSLPVEVSVIKFDPKTQSLVELVSQEVQKLGGAIFTAKENEPDIMSPVHCSACHQYVESEHFKELFERHPYISYGDHTNSERGEAWRFGQLENLFENFTKVYLLAPYFHGKLDFNPAREYQSDDLETIGKLIDHHLSVLDREFEQNEALEALKKEATKWKRMIIVEKWIKFGTLQSPTTEKAVNWIKSEILDKEVESFSEEEKKTFLESLERNFPVRNSFIERDKSFDYRIGRSLHGDQREVIERFSTDKEALFAFCIKQWYNKGDRTECERFVKENKFLASPSMFANLQFYMEKAQRLNPKYAQRAKEIVSWIGNAIQKETGDDEDRFFYIIKSSYMLDNYVVNEYRRIFNAYKKMLTSENTSS